jgi:hypothetical protein
MYQDNFYRETAALARRYKEAFDIGTGLIIAIIAAAIGFIILCLCSCLGLIVFFPALGLPG